MVTRPICLQQQQVSRHQIFRTSFYEDVRILHASEVRGSYISTGNNGDIQEDHDNDA